LAALACRGSPRVAAVAGQGVEPVVRDRVRASACASVMALASTSAMMAVSARAVVAPLAQASEDVPAAAVAVVPCGFQDRSLSPYLVRFDGDRLVPRASQVTLEVFKAARIPTRGLQLDDKLQEIVVSLQSAAQPRGGDRAVD
jgi:hypothetical protein